MEKKSVAYGFALAVLLMLAMSFGFSLASGGDFDLGRNTTFTNITTENLTVSDGSRSNVVLTTDTSVLRNNTVLNSTAGTWKKYSNGSIELNSVSTYTFQNATSDGRLGNTVYQNTNNTSRRIRITVDCGTTTSRIYASATNPPNVVVAIDYSPTNNEYLTVDAEILPNYYYNLSNSGACYTIKTWTEWN